jgi:hypothetical protein
MVTNGCAIPDTYSLFEKGDSAKLKKLQQDVQPNNQNITHPTSA